MNQINLLPEEIAPDEEGHIDDHKIIHAGLKDHETRMTQTEGAMGTKSDTNHKHSATDITSGTLAFARIPTGQTASTVAVGNDARFTDARTPKTHTHTSSDITDFDSKLQTKANISHQHAAEDIISGTVNVQRLPVGTASGTIAAGNDSRFTDARTPKAHTHTISNVTGLQDNLDSKADLVGGQIPTSQIPAIALTKPFAVTNRAAMLALDVQEGDIAIITGDNADKGSYILGSGPSNQFTSWMLLSVSSDAPVQSVNGQVGTIVLSPVDIGAAPSSHTHNASDISGALGSSVDASQTTVAVDNSGWGGENFEGPLSGHIANIYYISTNVDAMTTAIQGKSDIGHKHSIGDITTTGTASSTTYLRGDGSWVTPTNTTYTIPTQAEAEAGTATTARAFSAQRVRQSADAAISARIQLVSEFPATPTQGVLYLKAE